MAAPNKIDVNDGVQVYMAEETTLGVLPGTPKWFAKEVNSISDFGGDYQKTPRTPISSDRQNREGALTDLDASGSMSIDFTQNNQVKELRGFFFADTHEKPTTASLDAVTNVATDVDSATKTYAFTSNVSFLAGQLVKASGFTKSQNNGLKTVASTSTINVVVSETLTDETPGASAKMEACGFQFPADDVDLTVVGGASPTEIYLSSTLTDFTTLGLNVGEWVFIGGDSTATKFGSNDPGYASISAIAANRLDFDETTFTPTTEVSSGSKTIQMFFGRFLRNELSGSIVRRSYHIERQLGNDGDGVQAEYLKGAVANEFSLGIGQGNILASEMKYVGTDVEYVSGATGIKAGTRISAENEEAFNASSHVYRAQLSLHGSSFNQSALFAYLTDVTLSITNGVDPAKAIGVLGAFELTPKNFTVNGNFTAYFNSVAAAAAIKANTSARLNFIFSKSNAGFIFDIPKVQLDSSKIDTPKDSEIKMSLENLAIKCDNGYTLSYTNFMYLPTVANA